MTLNTARTPAGTPAAVLRPIPKSTRVKIFRSLHRKIPDEDSQQSVLLCLLLAGTAGCDRVTKHLAMTTLAGMPEQSFLAIRFASTITRIPADF
jgi:hypothetical protein